LSASKTLLKQTFVYGVATVFPRIFSFILVPLYTGVLPKDLYGEISIIFAYMVFFNVVLSYGMETSFFRFYNTESDRQKVLNTSTTTVFWSSMMFLVLGLLFRSSLSRWSGFDVTFISLVVWILVLDALTMIPFAKLRAQQKPMAYALIKIGNVVLNLGLNVFFLLYLKDLATQFPDSVWRMIYFENFEIGYIFVSLLIASLLTFLVLTPMYFKIQWKLDFILWKKMMRYGMPILIAGIAFSINETFDKILLDWLLPPNIAKSEVGAYSACYKLALFMTLFSTAFRLGIEPFFFSHAQNKNAPKTYATITEYFVIFGSVILLGVVVFADVLKTFMIMNTSYYEAMKVVPLIVLANLFLGIYHNLSVWYKLTDQTKMGAYISVIGALITLGLNFLLINPFSYMGSAFATLAAYGSMMFLSLYLGSKYYPIPYNLKKMTGYLGSSIIFSGVYFYFYRENYFVGIGFLMIFLFFVYRNEKKQFVSILKR
jgi:O-antigen/teichoic acid export membrane protein